MIIGVKKKGFEIWRQKKNILNLFYKKFFLVIKTTNLHFLGKCDHIWWFRKFPVFMCPVKIKANNVNNMPMK